VKDITVSSVLLGEIILPAKVVEKQFQQKFNSPLQCRNTLLKQISHDYIRNNVRKQCLTLPWEKHLLLLFMGVSGSSLILAQIMATGFQMSRNAEQLTTLFYSMTNATTSLPKSNELQCIIGRKCFSSNSLQRLW
jgi:hypothetical protein